MTSNICGNSASPRRGGIDFFGIEPDAARPRPDATHRANLRNACGVIVLFVVIVSSACSTRVEYSAANADAPSSNAININTASVDELEKLPHIGRKTAEAIVDFRTVNGPFRRIEQLMQIRGVSEERFANLRPHIKIE